MASMTEGNLVEQIQKEIVRGMIETARPALEEYRIKFEKELEKAKEDLNRRIKDYVARAALDVQGFMNVRLLAQEIVITIRIPEVKNDSKS
jgi:uncharacterized protein YaaN involved in tellurite resistance